MELENTEFVKSKKRILRGLYIATSLFSIFILIFSVYFIYQYLSEGISLSEIKSFIIQSIVNIATFSILIISIFFCTRYYKLFRWLFPIFFVIWIGFNLNQLWPFVCLPIILSAIVIEPIAAIIFGSVFFLEASIIYYLNGTVTLSVAGLISGFLPIFIVVLIYSVISYIISKELHKVFHLYEKQYVELQEAKTKLSEKVEIQSNEIEQHKSTIQNIEKERHEMSEQMSEMRERLEQLKSITTKVVHH
jgi:hypothetical protein